MKEVLWKVPGGKLVRVKSEVRGGKIVRVKICGDFFAYPEEGVEQVEAAVQGSGKEDVEQRIKRVVQEEGIEFIGCSSEDIIRMIKETYEEE